MKFRIRGVEGWEWPEVEAELRAGGRFVFFEYCISFLIVSRRGASDVYFLRGGQSGVLRGLPFSLLTILLGWWALPWGLIYAPLALYTNCIGGRDVTDDVLDRWPTVDDPDLIDGHDLPAGEQGAEQSPRSPG